MKGQDIVEILSQLGIKCKGNDNSRNITLACPFKDRHREGNDSVPSFVIKNNPYGPSVYYCFGCKAKGTMTKLLRVLQRHKGFHNDIFLEFSKLETVLATSSPKELANFARRVSDVPVPEDVKIGAIPKYLLRRGVSRKAAKDWELGINRTNRNAVFPVRNKRGVRVGFVEGNISDIGAKYPAMEGFEKTRYLYGEHMLKNWNHRPLILVEGMLDTVISHQNNVHGVMSTMGTVFTNHHKELIKSNCEVVYLLFDRDEPGLRFEEYVTRQLLGRVKIYVPTWFPPGKEDPKELNFEEYLDVLERCERV